MRIIFPIKIRVIYLAVFRKSKINSSFNRRIFLMILFDFHPGSTYF
ncbi:hypothetical protein ASZ90_004515 [hydrocarbon metagenome]|uniref:Uncharacterized protein n=1 Tax=hydrocarbon metagenome TaxID=938273 RepID=A0A0W8FXN1_9ZZZZ